MLLPARFNALQDKVGILYEPVSRSVCTAFCIDETTVATAAHCLFRKPADRPVSLSGVTFLLPWMERRARGVSIAGAGHGAAEQNVMTGTTRLSTTPPIDAARDWALIRLATPACRKGGLPLARRTPAELSASENSRPIYQVGYHRDYGDWRLTLSPPCAVRRAGQREGTRVIASDFSDSAALILHTCDTGDASSGSPLLVDGPRGPEVVGINVGTYLTSHVRNTNGTVLQRYRSDTVANTGVSTMAFLEAKDGFVRAALVQTRSGIRRMQQVLAEAGHYRGPIDGHFGPALRSAIEGFESAERRPRTGLATADLLRRLEAYSAAAQESASMRTMSEQFETGSVPPPGHPND